MKAMNGTITATFPPEGKLRGRGKDAIRHGDQADVFDDGSICLNKPRTHDISRTGSHVPSIEKVAADINYAVQAVWPKRHDIRYTQAHVLLLFWEYDDLGVEEEIKELRHVFEKRYLFGVEEHKIPSEKPDKNVKRRVLEFLENDGRESLLVVYYAGHARRGEQSNEGSIWFANRNDPSIAVPSGGIQSLLEEADADVLLLYDCCHSASVPTCKLGKGGVTEVIAACGYEAVAAEVDEHSFTKALVHCLMVASKESPFSVGELASRILSRLKCWAPNLARDADGNYLENPDGRLAYERQPRKTPIYNILSETRPRRSIVLGPLPPSPSLFPYANENSPCSSPPGSATSTPSTSSGESPSKKRKTAITKSEKCPQVLIIARVDQSNSKQDEWVNWIRDMPSNGIDVRIEGRWDSFSTLLLLRMPVAVWNLLPDNEAYDFVGFVTSNNMANLEKHTLVGNPATRTEQDQVIGSKVEEKDSKPSSASTSWVREYESNASAINHPEAIPEQSEKKLGFGSSPRQPSGRSSTQEAGKGLGEFRYIYYWTWACCACHEAGMTTEICCCPAPNCQHLRCDGCETESHKKRTR